ncbi:tumor necrosis factor receptor superfamily member 16-like [Biomphalaria glabrata]|uniref:Tumor necrosis factor receptor superfamily member 16-like n=1 Tax=Biomphalaria glabrata TaxID=6526 RepID=A0A9W2ZAL5_BIOGL|nr:tumor necrosis factor receptor superfamily member 16-like [Biomphalaria glabrata]
MTVWLPMLVLVASLPIVSMTPEEVCDPDVPSRSLLTDHSQSHGNVKCPEGEYSRWGVCSPCQEGTFRTKLMAEQDYPACLACQVPDPGMNEIVIKPCSKTRDALIMCEYGFYRSETPGKPCDSKCKRCSICGMGTEMFKDNEALNCSDTQDTLCCANKNVADEVGRRCVEMTSARPTTPSRVTEVSSAASSAMTSTEIAQLAKSNPEQSAGTGSVSPCLSSKTLIIWSKFLALAILKFLCNC